MAAESEMSAFSKIRKAAAEREWCPERPYAEAAEQNPNDEGWVQNTALRSRSAGSLRTQHR